MTHLHLNAQSSQEKDSYTQAAALLRGAEGWDAQPEPHFFLATTVFSTKKTMEHKTRTPSSITH
jgi:hypothetical protein